MPWELLVILVPAVRFNLFWWLRCHAKLVEVLSKPPKKDFHSHQGY